MKELHKKIKQYAKKCAKYGKGNLDVLENIQRKAEGEAEDKIKAKNLPYAKECNEISVAHKEIQDVFDHYFGQKNMNGAVAGYDWINGNQNFQQLKLSK